MISKRNLGIFILTVSIIFLITIIIFSYQINNLILELMRLSNNNCFIDGKCTHQQSNLPIYIGLIAVIINIILGVYLIIFNKSELEVQDYIDAEKEQKNKEEKFEILLKALDEDEKKIMKAVKEQDGISQSTLRIRTDMSKAKLSIVLSNLERRNLIKKIQEGKFNKIFIKTFL